MKKQTFGWKMSRWLILVLMLSVVLASCSFGSGDNKQGEEPTTIKVMAFNEQSFNQEYGMLFYALYPNIEIEVASTSSIELIEGDYHEKLDEFIRNEKPDILMLDLQQYDKYAADGRLVSLESFITRDKFDLEGLAPGMVDFLREKGGGELYGLAPFYYSQAVFYNKDLFDRFNIEYPTDGMSWEELLNLAGRFPTDGSDEERVYGLNIGYMDLQNLAQQIGLTYGLRIVNPADKRVSIDTDSWARVFETALNAIRSGTLYQDNFNFSGTMTYEEYLLRDPFISGKVAMTFGQYYLIQQIREAAAALPDKVVKNWDLVTMPVDPANPEYSSDISFYNIFAINAESTNRDAAWEFIRYIHSDDYARVRSKSYNVALPARTKYIQDEEGRNVAAFYTLKPSGANQYPLLNDLPDSFSMHYYSIIPEELQAVMNDEKTVKEALASIQTRLQAALDEALENEKNGKNAAETPDPAVSADIGVSVVPADSGEAETGASGEDAAE